MSSKDNAAPPEWTTGFIVSSSSTNEQKEQTDRQQQRQDTIPNQYQSVPAATATSNYVHRVLAAGESGSVEDKLLLQELVQAIKALQNSYQTIQQLEESNNALQEQNQQLLLEQERLQMRMQAITFCEYYTEPSHLMESPQSTEEVDTESLAEESTGSSSKRTKKHKKKSKRSSSSSSSSVSSSSSSKKKHSSKHKSSSSSTSSSKKKSASSKKKSSQKKPINTKKGEIQLAQIQGFFERRAQERLAAQEHAIDNDDDDSIASDVSSLSGCSVDSFDSHDSQDSSPSDDQSASSSKSDDPSESSSSTRTSKSKKSKKHSSSSSSSKSTSSRKSSSTKKKKHSSKDSPSTKHGTSEKSSSSNEQHQEPHEEEADSSSIHSNDSEASESHTKRRKKLSGRSSSSKKKDDTDSDSVSTSSTVSKKKHKDKKKKRSKSSLSMNNESSYIESSEPVLQSPLSFDSIEHMSQKATKHSHKNISSTEREESIDAPRQDQVLDDLAAIVRRNRPVRTSKPVVDVVPDTFGGRSTFQGLANRVQQSLWTAPTHARHSSFDMSKISNMPLLSSMDNVNEAEMSRTDAMEHLSQVIHQFAQDAPLWLQEFNEDEARDALDDSRHEEDQRSSSFFSLRGRVLRTEEESARIPLLERTGSWRSSHDIPWFPWNDASNEESAWRNSTCNTDILNWYDIGMAVNRIVV